MAFNIAIDGPAGAGKSTIAKKLAADLGYVYVDTGAMYRAMAYYFLQNHIDASNEQAIAAACPKVDVTIQYMGGEQQVILNGENVNGVIRKEEVGNMASATSVYPVVRTKLVELQRQLAAPLLICTERDLIFPITTADVSTTTGPCTSISPLIAPAITAEAAEILPMITEPAPILTVPELTTSPSTFATSAKNSEAALFPLIVPVTTSLPLQVTFPLMVP